MRIGKFRREQRGQTLVIVALMLVPLLGFTGLVTDVAWYEVNLMRIQRAADAAALAGVVYLPQNVPGAQTAAQQEAAKNGYTNGAPGVTVTATPEALNNRILSVSVAAPVRSWFARLNLGTGGDSTAAADAGMAVGWLPDALSFDDAVDLGQMAPIGM